MTSTITETPSITPEELSKSALAAFKAQFGSAPTCVSFAPGRVNVIGEHTDYNNGFVMPIALELGTVAVGRIVRSTLRADTAYDELSIHIATRTKTAAAVGETMDVKLTYKHQALLPGQWSPQILPIQHPRWANYILGSVAGYSEELLQLCSSKNSAISIDILVESSVPIGAGLSSSAAVEVSTYYLMHSLLELPGATPPVEKAALACQQVEHKFAGVPCGIMDQMISAGGRANSALLIDCRDLTYRYVPLPSSKEAVFVIADTGVRHQLATSEYSIRRKQCEAASKRLGVSSLREISTWDNRQIDEGDVEMRRARHVITEDERCLKAAELMSSDGQHALVELGKLMVASHRSLQKDYEVSCKELDHLVETALKIDGVFGSRMTGGGFGGSTVTLADPKCVKTLTEALKKEGAVRTLIVSAADGARILFRDTPAGPTA